MRKAAFAAKKVILPCEEIVDRDTIVHDSNRNLIPKLSVTTWCINLWVRSPFSTPGYARRDDDFYFEYHHATRSPRGFRAMAEDWILDVTDHNAFLNLLGSERIKRLRPEGNLFSRLQLLTGRKSYEKQCHQPNLVKKAATSSSAPRSRKQKSSSKSSASALSTPAAT